MCILYSPNTHLNCALVYYATVCLKISVELTPRATGNGYRNMWIAIFEREYESVAFRAYAVQ
jgi:hypothetical protein